MIDTCRQAASQPLMTRARDNSIAPVNAANFGYTVLLPNAPGRRTGPDAENAVSEAIEGAPMIWEVRERYGKLSALDNRQGVIHYMENDAGSQVEIVGLHPFDRVIYFKLTSKDLQVKFSAAAAKRGASDDEPVSLGPICKVSVLSRDVSGPISKSDGERVALTITSFLLEYHRFPTAEPPFPRSVVLNDIAKKALNLI